MKRLPAKIVSSLRKSSTTRLPCTVEQRRSWSWNWTFVGTVQLNAFLNVRQGRGSRQSTDPCSSRSSPSSAGSWRRGTCETVPARAGIHQEGQQLPTLRSEHVVHREAGRVGLVDRLEHIVADFGKAVSPAKVIVDNSGRRISVGAQYRDCPPRFPQCESPRWRGGRNKDDNPRHTADS